MSEFLKNRERLYQIIINFPLNGSFVLELVCFMYLIIPLDIKDSIRKLDARYGIVFFVLLMITSMLISIFQSPTNREYLKLVNYSIFIVVLLNIIIYLILPSLNISLNIIFNISIVSTCLLTCLELVLNTVQDFVKSIALIIIGIFITSLILPLTYLVNRLIGYLIIVICFVSISTYKKRIRILLKSINKSIIDQIISFVFYSIVVICVGTIWAFYFKDLQSLFNDWLPFLANSISLIIVGISYYPELRKIHGLKTLVLYYFLLWAIFPTLLFILYLQRYHLGYYSVFKIILGIILCFDAIVILTFGSDMANLLLGYQKENNLIRKEKVKISISRIKVILGNITVFTTLANTIFSKEEITTKCIEKISKYYYQIGKISDYYFGKYNMDYKFKMIIFQVSVIVVILLLSGLAFKLEKIVYRKVIFGKAMI